MHDAKTEDVHAKADVQLMLQGDPADTRRQPDIHRVEDHPEWDLLSCIPMLLTAAIPVKRFRVRDLLKLRTDQTIESASLSSEDVPVHVGTTQIAWSEFEVVGQRMAIRLTRLC